MERTQHEMIHDKLLAGERLTCSESLYKMGIYALAQRISEMRRDLLSFFTLEELNGRIIDDAWLRDGRKKYKEYFLA